jgi:hypothetical protein
MEMVADYFVFPCNRYHDTDFFHYSIIHQSKGERLFFDNKKTYDDSKKS